MDDNDMLVRRFEDNRAQLRAVAYRMLGSASEAEDAVQETWIRLNRAGADGVDNLGGWLTTVVARVCLDMLRSRKSRREQPWDDSVPEPATSDSLDPEHEALLADAVGPALLVVLDTLAPAERLSFVLHDMFDLPYDQIATIVGRSPAAARQLASRARRRVQSRDAVSKTDPAQQHRIVDAFMAASRAGDFAALLALLDPDVVLRVDAVANIDGRATEIRGAHAVVTQALSHSGGRRFARPAYINGVRGIAVVPKSVARMLLTFTVSGGKIQAIDVIADPERVSLFDVRVDAL